jgi:hypothetical protein
LSIRLEKISSPVQLLNPSITTGIAVQADTLDE